MNCYLPPAIPDRALLAYLDGEGQPDIAAHLARCPVCAQRAAELRAGEARLRQLLYRVECPDAQVLSDFRQGYLAPAQQREVATHVARCPHCTAELARLDSFLADIGLPLTGRDVRRVVPRLVARLVDWGNTAADVLGNAMLPASPYGAMRGDDLAPQVYQVEDIQVILEIEADPTRPGRRRLQGLVTRVDGEVEGTLTQAQLTAEGRSQVTTQVDDLGNFAFGGLTLGAYSLTLAGPTLEVTVEAVTL